MHTGPDGVDVLQLLVPLLTKGEFPQTMVVIISVRCVSLYILCLSGITIFILVNAFTRLLANLLSED